MFGINYNVFRIMGGIGNLVFSNKNQNYIKNFKFKDILSRLYDKLSSKRKTSSFNREKIVKEFVKGVLI